MKKQTKKYTLEELQWVQERTKVKAVKDYKLHLQKQIEETIKNWTEQRDCYKKSKEKISVYDSIDADIDSLKYIIQLINETPMKIKPGNVVMEGE